MKPVQGLSDKNVLHHLPVSHFHSQRCLFLFNTNPARIDAILSYGPAALATDDALGPVLLFDSRSCVLKAAVFQDACLS
jgi:hypothetical protein